MKCKLLALTPETWRAYTQLCGSRGYPVPPAPPSAAFVAGKDERWETPRLLSGAVIYPLDGKFVVLDHFVTNPEAPARNRRDAALYTLRAAQTIATIMGFTLALHPRTGPALRRFVHAHGLKADVQAPFAPPGVEVPWQMFAPEKKRAPKAPLPAEPELPTRAAKVAKARPRRKRSK